MGILLTPLCYAIALVSGAGGLVVMGLFFPYVMLIGLLMPNTSWVIAILISTLQFPLYGAAFGAARLRNRLRETAIGLAITHFLTAIIFMVLISYRSN